MHPTIDTTATSEPAHMDRVHVRDLAGVTWTLAGGFISPRAHRVLAAAAWPMWVFVVLALPGFVHADRSVVARVTRRTPAAMLATFARVLGIFLALCAALLVVFVAVFLQWLPAIVTMTVLLFLALWFVLAVLVTLVRLAPGYARIYRAGTRARRAHTRAQRHADRDLYRAAQWTLDSVASRLPAGGLATISQYLRHTLSADDRVVAQAATPRHVTVYRRFGFTQLPTAPLTLHAVVAPPRNPPPTLRLQLPTPCEDGRVSTSDVTPAGYAELLERLKDRVRTSQVRAARAANTELLRLYWSIGRDILDRQQTAGWGAKVVDQLATDLRAEFPDQRGWSRRNLLYMRAVAQAWPDEDAFVQQAVAQLPWGHVTVLLTRLDDPAHRDWYAAQAAEHGWSRSVLENQIASHLHQRIGAAPTNFTTHLTPADSELAQQLVRDPYVFDHLDLTGRVHERDMEQALMDKLQDTLLEFGHGMAFVGRQVRFTVAGDELVIDLLLFNVDQLRYVVVELKIGQFESGHVGQLGTYVALVDDRLRKPDRHAHTVGILLVAGRNEAIVRYALAGAPAPLAVANYTYDSLPPDERAVLPRADELTAILERETDGDRPNQT